MDETRNIRPLLKQALMARPVSVHGHLGFLQRLPMVITENHLPDG